MRQPQSQWRCGHPHRVQLSSGGAGWSRFRPVSLVIAWGICCAAVPPQAPAGHAQATYFMLRAAIRGSPPSPEPRVLQVQVRPPVPVLPWRQSRGSAPGQQAFFQSTAVGPDRHRQLPDPSHRCTPRPRLQFRCSRARAATGPDSRPASLRRRAARRHQRRPPAAGLRTEEISQLLFA